jgi:hypothetical protein
MSQLTDHGRRVLAHLPIWVEDEEAHVALEGGAGVSVRSYSLPDFARRLAEDPYTTVSPDGVPRPLTEAECKLSLDGLVSSGLASFDGEYRMTREGREALEAPAPVEGQVPGSVTVDVAPAVGFAEAAS